MSDESKAEEALTFEDYAEVLRERHPTWDVGVQCPECRHGALVRIPRDVRGHAAELGVTWSRWMCTLYGQCELSCG